jgi:hypothetical protein
MHLGRSRRKLSWVTVAEMDLGNTATCPDQWVWCLALRRPLGACQLFFPPDMSAAGLKLNAAPFMQ